MRRIAFADESGLDGLSPCYSIGVVSFDHGCLAAFDEFFRQKLTMHGVVGEAKWKKISTSHGLINFGLDALDSIIRSHSGSFDAIVVNTAQYRNWHSPLRTKEEAFYKTYTLLLSHIADRCGLPAEIFIDDRTDSYNKRDEAMAKIANNMLAKLASNGHLESVTKIKSHDCPGVQIADMLTGAFNASHARLLNPRLPLHYGKKIAIERIAEMLGWDDLCYDTMPSDRVNVWHFPIQFRNFPATRPVLWGREPRYVTAVDLMRARSSGDIRKVVAARKSA